MEKNSFGFLSALLLSVIFIFPFSHSLSIDTLSKFSFESNSRFIRMFIPASLNSTRVFGLFETSDSSVVFELRFGSNLDVINMPAADIELSIESVTGFCPEESYQNGTELHIELEIEETSFTVRSRNAENYPLESSLIPNEHFRILFFPSDELCVLPVVTTISHQSEFHLSSDQKNPSPSSSTPSSSSSTSSSSSGGSRSTKRSRFNYNPDPTQYPQIRRTATMRSAFERTTQKYGGKVRFATYKMLNSFQTTPPSNEVSYIDILKDRDTYEQVQRSETREFNNDWSLTFLLFFCVESLIIGGFVIFGFVMFIILQCKTGGGMDSKPIQYDS